MTDHAAPAPDRQLRDLEVLLDVARAMTATLELDPLLTQILESMRQVLGTERATLFLYDAARHELYSKISHDLGEIRFPADKGIAGAAAMTRKTINIPDAYADPRFNQAIDKQTGFHTRCLLTVPLVGLEARLVGVVQAVNKIGGVFNTYDEHLAEALAAQVGVAIQRAQLMSHYVQKKQLEQNLTIAREIQQNLLPKAPPKVPGYAIAGWCQPADETGGDCFDYQVLPNKRVALTVADVTGHGIGPALVVAETRALLRSIVQHVDRPEDVLTEANAHLCNDLTEGRFVTAFFGILDPGSHRLDYASAGHGPLLWYRAAEDRVFSTDATGSPLGWVDPLIIDAAEPFTFAVGDLGVFLTDGFPEARDVDNAFFGPERLHDLIRAHAAGEPAALIRAMAEAVKTFRGQREQLDDLTAVVVKRCA